MAGIPRFLKLKSEARKLRALIGQTDTGSLPDFLRSDKAAANAGAFAGLSGLAFLKDRDAAQKFVDILTGAIVTPLPTLQPLTLSGSLRNGSASTGTIANALAGTVITTTMPGLAINSALRTYAFNGNTPAGSIGVLVETGNASNSPRTTNLTVLEASTVGPEPGIEANNVAAPTNIAGPITGLAPTDTGSLANYIQVRLTGTQTDGAIVNAGLLPDGSGYRGLRIVTSNPQRWGGASRRADGTFDGDFPSFQVWPDGGQPGVGDFLRVERTIDKISSYVIKDGASFLVHAESAAQGSQYFGQLVALEPSFGIAYSEVEYGVIGAGVPLRIVSQSFLSGFTPQAVLEYSGAPKRVYVQIENAGGGVILPRAEVQYDLLTKGRVTVRSKTGLPNPSTFFGGSVVVRWFTYDSAGEVISSDFKQLEMPGRAPSFGFNIHGADTPYEGFSIMANVAVQAYWQRSPDGVPNQNGSVTTDEFGNPTLVEDQRQLAPGPTKGRYDVTGDNIMEITWEQDAGIDATWAMRVVGGDNINYSQPVSTGPRKAEYREVFDYTNGATFGGLTLKSFPAGNPPKKLKVYKKGMDKNQIFSDEFVYLQNSVRGAIRWLDPRKINENHYANYAFADRTTIEKQLKWSQDGIPLEWMIALSNATGKDLWFNAPGWFQDDYYTKCFKAMDTGEGLNTTDPNAAMWRNGLNPGLQFYVEWVNEVWNSGFGIFSHASDKYAERMGIPPAAGNNGQLGFEYNKREHVFQHNRVMTLLEAAVPNPTRYVRVVGTQLDGGGHYDDLIAKGMTHIDAHAQAPYVPIRTSQIVGLPDKTPASLKPIFMQSAINAMDIMVGARNKSKANGHRFITYEGGADVFPPTSGLSDAEVRTFKRSQECEDVMRYYYSRWVSDFGDLFMQYTDTGQTWGAIDVEGSSVARSLIAMYAAQATIQ